MVLPAASVAVGAWVWMTLGRSDTKPFAGAAAIFVLAFIGLAYSLFPYVVMDQLTIWDAAADDSALAFLGAGVLFVLPFILAWQIYSYRVFRGKVHQGIYEH
jgi:cytochrome d ubiquinol oxidase subunit II